MQGNLNEVLKIKKKTTNINKKLRTYLTKHLLCSITIIKNIILTYIYKITKLSNLYNHKDIKNRRKNAAFMFIYEFI